MPNFQAETGLLEHLAYKDLYDKAIDDAVVRDDESPLIGERFFRKVDVDNVTYKEASMGRSLDLPVKNEDGDPLPYVQPATGFPKELTLVMFRSAIRVQRKMVELDQHSAIMDMIDGLGLSVRRKYEYSYADIFNNGFATHTTGDAAYVFSNSHLQEDAAAGTYDNLEAASALSFGSFDTAVVNMQNRTNDKGMPMPLDLGVLIVPTNLRRKALELQGAPMQPENAIHQPNVYQGKFEVEVWPWLTSSTAHFFWGKIDNQSPANGFVCAERVAPSTASVSYEDPDIILGKRVRFEYVCGAIHARHVHGSAGA